MSNIHINVRDPKPGEVLIWRPSPDVAEAMASIVARDIKTLLLHSSAAQVCAVSIELSIRILEPLTEIRVTCPEEKNQ